MPGANTPKRMIGAGRAHAEPPETAWAYFGAFGPILQYMTHGHRHDFLEFLIQWYNQRKKERMPKIEVRLVTLDLLSPAVISPITSLYVHPVSNYLCVFFSLPKCFEHVAWINRISTVKFSELI